MRKGFGIWVLGLLHFIVSGGSGWLVVIEIVRMSVFSTMVGFPYDFEEI